MSSVLNNSGVPLIADYLAVEEHPLYRDMERYSDDFLEKRQGILQEYGQKWVREPFHQWSRKCEYPWVAHQLEKGIHGDRAKILDAGSGLTFFPSYLSERHLGWEIRCVDFDEKLTEPYSKLGNPQVRFSQGDLRDLPF